MKSISESTGATCRFAVSNATLISNHWTMSNEEKQPISSLKWIQGQNASSLLFVEARPINRAESPSVKVSESVEGRRPWRREMIKDCYVTNIDNETLDCSFLSNTVDFVVPEPLPDDDVSEHTWLDELASEMVSVVVQWNAEIIDENGLRKSHGQSWVHLDDIFQNKINLKKQIPLKCYINAPHRMEHAFSSPCRVSCTITIENSAINADMDVTLSFQQIFDAVAGLGQTGNHAFIWSGLSEKRISIVSILV